MKHKLKATELKNVDVTHISLVKRASSRVPLRITKSDLFNQESTMLNLNTLGRRIFKSEPAAKTTPDAPVLVAVAVDGLTADAEKVLTALKAAGVEVTRAQKSEDGVTTFLGDADLDQDVEIVKASPQVALVFKGFSPYSENMRQGTFGEMATARGFWGGMRSATEVLVEKVEGELYGADDKSAAVVKAEAHLKEFSSYLSSLINALPEKAFKAEQVVSALQVEAAELARKAEEDAAKAKKAEEDAAAAASKENKTAEEVKKAEPAPAVDASMTKALEALTQMGEAISALTKKVDDYSTSLEAVKKTQEEHRQAVDAIARKAETAAQAVKTTTLAAPKAGDNPAQDGQTTQKADTDWRTGVFDTALHRRQV